MIYLTKFSLNTTPLKLKTSDLIENFTKIEVQGLLKILESDLNHNVENSLLYRFNTIKSGEEVELPEYVIDFIKINLNLSRGYQGSFKPFLPTLLNEEIDQVLEIKKMKVKKNKDVVLDSSFLRKPFIIDYLNKYLSEKVGIIDYMIEFDNLFCANGNKEFVIAHTSIPGTYGISNESILIEDYFTEQIKRSDIKSSKIIISSDSCCINRIEYMLFPELHSVEEFQEYSEKNNLKFLILDEELNNFEFPQQ